MSELLDSIPQSAFRSTERSKFQPKLSREDRLAVLAFYSAGITKRVLAAAFGIDRRTVGHIINPQSLKYKDVREEMQRLGAKELQDRYITEEAVEKVRAALRSEEAALPNNAYKKNHGPRERANSFAGIHVVKPDQCAYSHRIEIKFIEGVGWQYRDLDSKSTPDEWLHNGEESLTTSDACYKMAVLNLTDD